MICYKCLKTVEPEKCIYGLHKACFREWFQLQNLSEFEKIRAKASSFENNPTAFFSSINSSFYQGKFKKYSALLDNQQYILKVEEKDYPELPAIEYLCNQIAEFLKLKVPVFYFILFHDHRTFVSKNFIRLNGPETLHHIYHFISKETEFECATLIKVIENETKRLSEMEKFVELCLFDSLIGNHDRHGRNLALIEFRGQKILSPFYDNPSYLGIEDESLLEAQHSPRGKIATSETNEPLMSDYVIEFKKLGHQVVAEKFFKKIKIDQICKLIDKSFISEKRKGAFKRLILERYSELKNGI